MTPEIDNALGLHAATATPRARRLTRSIAALAAAGGMAFSVAAPATAQPVQEGLVNVNVGDVTILEDVGIGVAANVAANICGVQVNAAVIAEQVVRNDEPLAVCETSPQGGPVTITT
jgi:glycerate kinase